MLIDVLIYITGMLRGQYKAPAGGTTNLPGLRVVFACALEQTEFLSPANGRTAVVYPELGVNVIGVSPQGVQGHHELTGNLRSGQVGSEQPEHVKLTHAQWLDQTLFDRRSVLSRAQGCQESTDIARGGPVFRGRFQ